MLFTRMRQKSYVKTTMAKNSKRPRRVNPRKEKREGCFNEYNSFNFLTYIYLFPDAGMSSMQKFQTFHYFLK